MLGCSSTGAAPATRPSGCAVHATTSGWFKPTSVSWRPSTFPSLGISLDTTNSLPKPTPRLDSVICAAWTRRSRTELAKNPRRKSWKQRTDMYMRPFLLNVFFSKRFIHAKVMHRATSKVISVATTNSKDLRHSLPSLVDHNACRLVGQLIAERSKEADVYAMSYDPRKEQRIEVVSCAKVELHWLFAWKFWAHVLLAATNPLKMKLNLAVEELCEEIIKLEFAWNMWSMDKFLLNFLSDEVAVHLKMFGSFMRD